MAIELELADARKELALQRIATRLVARGLSLADAEAATAEVSHRVLIRNYATDHAVQLIDAEGEAVKGGLDAFADAIVAARGAADSPKPKGGKPVFQPNRQEGSRASSADPDEVAEHLRRVDYGI